MWPLLTIFVGVPIFFFVACYFLDTEKYNDPWEDTRTKQPDDFV